MISNKVKEVRNIRGMSISELARRTKLSRVTISNVENKEVIPSLETALLIARELDYDIGDIFFESYVNHEFQHAEEAKQ